jgi:DNA-directed RNA polymerase sigma subunit (sigma70/sigma32)
VNFPQVDAPPNPQIQQNTLTPETPDVLGQDIVEQMSELSPRERDVLRLQFGLDDGHARSPDEIAQLLGVTEQRIRQIAKTAFDKLRDPADVSEPQEGTSAFRQIPRSRLLQVLRKLPQQEREMLRFKWGFTDGIHHSAHETAKLLNVPVKLIKDIELRVVRQLD